MPSSRQLIASQVLGSSAASVTFSAIPSTYTDLVLRVSARTNGATAAITQLSFNGSTSNFSYTAVRGDGSTASSLRSTTVGFAGNLDSTADTANTFGSSEIYIPNYTASANKPVSSFAARENNATAAMLGAWAVLWSNTAAITSITLTDYNGNSWDTGSSFYLYGLSS